MKSDLLIGWLKTKNHKRHSE